jgi:hypothetical protein
MEKIKFALRSAASDLYENATDVSSNEILGDASMLKKFGQIYCLQSLAQVLP